MDTITHGIVGALAGKAFFAGPDEPAHLDSGGTQPALSSPTAKAAIVACTIGSVFPDIDIFAGRLARNPLAIMEWHRNITHSLVMLPVWALLLAWASQPLARRLRWKLPPFPRLAVIYAIGLFSHIFLDMATSFGTMTWSPVNYSRIAWDWIFIVDFTFSGIALVPQLAAWCYREPERFAKRAAVVWVVLSAGALGVYKFAQVAGYAFPLPVVAIASALIAMLIFAPRIRRAGFGWKRASWSRAALAALCVYLAMAAVAHRKAIAVASEFAAARHLHPEAIAALPLPPTLTHWAGMISTPDGLWRTTFRVPGGQVDTAEYYASADSNRFIEEAKSLRDVQVYLWFARFPIWRVEHVQGDTVAEVTDVRFFRRNFQQWESDPHPSTHRPKPGGSSPGFTYRIVFDSDGKIVSDGFRRRE